MVERRPRETPYFGVTSLPTKKAGARALVGCADTSGSLSLLL